MSGGRKLSKEEVLSLTKPVVFHDMINNWPALRWEIKDWSSVFGDRQLPFRCGVKSCSPEPMWEVKCSKETMTIEEFSNLKQQTTEPTEEGKKWFYFDYHQISDWTCSDLKDAMPLKWDAFGFPDKGAEDSTIWIGSKGAHTPCHFDTYGCNLVAQVVGRKRWILFSQDDTEDMRPTRVPYEESSVYSLWNFNCPLPPEFYDKCDRRPYIVDLSPGDVLFVPRHWWHYVESLDFSISINMWLPKDPEDDVSRLDEAFVRLLFSQMSKSLSAEERRRTLNPNESDLADVQLHNSMNILYFCAQDIQSFRKRHSEAEEPNEAEEPKEPPAKQPKVDVSDGSELSSVLEMENVELVPCSTSEQLKCLMDQTCSCLSEERHVQAMMPTNLSDFGSRVQNVLNAFCHPDVVAQVRKRFSEVSKMDVN
ncbi:HSPB1-associated protein 1 [Frankliniella fusca]|uniref:HSPB1-associated protein 1 n=1 Tax=Frankliniella fusca TaxID=407009 RepID=A0AAE1LF72_9NEOP|nr:HSPB1-associated protein 1 [Frankliniella fusca]